MAVKRNGTTAMDFAHSDEALMILLSDDSTAPWRYNIDILTTYINRRK